MADRTCATCRYWVTERVPKDSDYQMERHVPRDLRIWDQATFEDISPFEVRLCGSPLLREYERPTKNGASTVDGSEYMSALVTGPDWGCIHHTPLSDS